MSDLWAGDHHFGDPSPTLAAERGQVFGPCVSELRDPRYGDTAMEGFSCSPRFEQPQLSPMLSRDP